MSSPRSSCETADCEIIALERSSLICDTVRVMDVELHDEVDQWLEDLSDSEWIRASIVIDRLAGLGHTARMPFSRALGDGLFEVRFTLGRTARRITYRFTQDQRIVLLTTFRKTKQNEAGEVTRARAAAAKCAETNP